VNETDRLRDLDALMRDTVDAMDSMLADTTPPPFEASLSRRTNRKRWAPLLIAAGLLVVALVAATSLSVSDEHGTIAGEGENPTGVNTSGGTVVALDDPQEAGFTLRAASPGLRPDDDVPPEATVQVPDNGSPWERAVTVATTPYGPGAFQGRVVDVGGPEAVIRARDSALAWRDGDRAHSVASTRLGSDELIAIVTEAVAVGWNGSGALPGHEIAAVGSMLDLVPLFEPGLLSPDVSLISYAHPGDLDFVLASRPGSYGLWQALLVNATEVRPIDFGDKFDALVGTYASRGSDPLSVITWLAEDSTVVRIATHGEVNELARLIEDRLVNVGPEGFNALVADHPASGPDFGLTGNAPTEMAIDFTDFDGPWSPPPGGRLRAEATSRLDGTTSRVALIEDDRLDLFMQVASVDAGRGGGTSVPIDGLTGPAFPASSQLTTPLETDGRANSGVRVVSGVIPRGWTLTEVRDQATGVPFPVLDQQQAPVDGVDSVLVLGVVETADADAILLEVVLTAPDGRSERHWL
jgi:hypothetical protein